MVMSPSRAAANAARALGKRTGFESEGPCQFSTPPTAACCYSALSLLHMPTLPSNLVHIIVNNSIHRSIFPATDSRIIIAPTLLFIVELDFLGSSPTDFDQVYNDASIVVDEGGLAGAARGQKVARSRGVKGAKKLSAVAAAQGVSRSLEPRIGNKRSVQDDFFYVAGRRQSYDDGRDLQSLDMHREREREREAAQSRASMSTSSSSSNISMSSNRNIYPTIERQSLSSAEIKLERMQKAALEKAEKVRKVVEEKAAKIRKLAEEKANKLRCLAEEKVILIFHYHLTPCCQSLLLSPSSYAHLHLNQVVCLPINLSIYLVPAHVHRLVLALFSSL